MPIDPHGAEERLRGWYETPDPIEEHPYWKGDIGKQRADDIRTVLRTLQQERDKYARMKAVAESYLDDYRNALSRLDVAERDARVLRRLEERLRWDGSADCERVRRWIAEAEA